MSWQDKEKKRLKKENTLISRKIKKKIVEEDKTKLFFDENLIKQSFQKKKQITESEKSEDFKKKVTKKVVF